MAYRAKVRIGEMEFVQFHPTVLYGKVYGKSFLISEAVRGFGAYLRDGEGVRFMPKFDERAELAPRDIVSRAIDTVLKKSNRPFVYFADKGRNNPDGPRGTNKVRTVMEGQYRSLSYVGDHTAVVVDEPFHLFGENTAPAPGEIVLSALGGCLAVGITAVATWKNVKLSHLEIFLEGDISNTAAWGAGGADRIPSQMGFQEIRVKVNVEGDATREELNEIVQRANYFSPVANSMRNPIAFKIALAD